MFTPRIHRYIFIIGLIGLAAGMMFGTVPTSIPQFVLFGNWLLEGRWKEKWSFIKSNHLFWILGSVFFLHLVGLIFTIDLPRGIDDIRIKIPMLLLPLVFFSTSPLTKSELNLVLKFFVAGVVVSAMWCLFYNFSHELTDIRKASRFMSHIRFGLFINLAIAVLVYFFKETKNLTHKLAVLLMIAFLIATMFVLSLVTGLVMLTIMVGVYLLYLVLKQKTIYKVAGLSAMIIVAVVTFYFFKSEWQQFNFVSTDKSNSQKSTSYSGRAYFTPDTANKHKENGYYITYNLQYDELHEQWPLRSKLPVYGKDKKGGKVIWTLIRYLSSKGLTKDSVGIASLTNEDIVNIESGVTNYLYVDASPIANRLHELFWEYRDYKQGSNPSGNTLLMRMEFWKAAIYIIKRSPWIGVGTGDAQRAFDKAYYRTETKLSREWRLRSHNQFLAITVAFGVIGLIVFLFSLAYPAVALRNYLHGLYFVFLLIAVVSFFTEDTLETQSGVSFFAFFNTLFIWLASFAKKSKVIES